MHYLFFYLPSRSMTASRMLNYNNAIVIMTIAVRLTFCYYFNVQFSHLVLDQINILVLKKTEFRIYYICLNESDF